MGACYMLTLSLDEAGTFEISNNQSNTHSETTLIAGVVFDDRGKEGEKDTETKRIEAYYRSVFKQAAEENPKESFIFPVDLHFKNESRKGQLKIIKETVRLTLPEFLQLGTFKGKELYYNDEQLPERTGFYRIAAIVKSNEGKVTLADNKQNEFFRDNIGSNTYFHMMSEAVEHFVFHNPLAGDNKFSFDIATRKTGYFNVDDEAKEIYLEQGFENNEAAYLGKNRMQFDLLTSDVFRTILMEQFLDNPTNQVSIQELLVQPIAYKVNEDEDYSNQVFLYLADSICTYLTYKIGDNDISEIRKRAQRLSNIKNLIFCYDEVDIFFKRAWRDMEVHEYYDALKEMYSISEMNTEAATLYKNEWFKSIKERIYKETEEAVSQGKEPHALLEAITELRASYMTNTLNPKEGEFIFGVLENAVKRIDNQMRYAKLMYYINDIGVVVNCHNGNIQEATEYFKECENYAFEVEMEDYIRTRNRYCNALVDSFDYEDAIKVARVTVELAGGLNELSKKVLGTRRKEHFGKIEYGKSLSQIGQIAAFMGREEATDFFEGALKAMNEEIANTKITESYKLHYLLDCGKVEEYKRGMVDYNDGADSILDQIKAIRLNWEKQNVNISFALYIYLKGLYKFYTDEELEMVWEDIKALETEIGADRKKAHPWELIYKYLGLIAFRLNDKTLAKEYMEKLADFIVEDKANIVGSIAMCAEAELSEVMGDIVEAKSKYDRLYNYLEKYFSLFNPENIELQNFEEKKEFIKSRFTYMYC